MIRQKLSQLGWEVLIHPPCSSDTAPLDVHYYNLYKILLMEKIFNSLEEYKRHQEQFFAPKDEQFGEEGIMKLPERWQKVVERNGKYVVQ